MQSLLIQNHCEEIAGLVFSAQLTPSEREQLANHLSICAECRSELGDIALIVAQLPNIADKRNPSPVSAGLTERFIARARSEGIPLSRKKIDEEVPDKLFKQAGFVPAFAVAALFIVAIGSVIVLQSRPTGRVTTPSQESVVTPSKEPTRMVPKAFRPDDQLLQENTNLKAEIRRMEQDLAMVSAKLNSDQEALKAAETANAALKSRLNVAETADSGLRQVVADRDMQVTQINGELEKLQALKDSDALAFKVEESELNNLREQVAKLDVKLRESEQLSAAANQARDLIVARHLHIVDVDDTDENGKQQRPFGRIFYTEGKKLVFYAYDLGDPRRLDTKISFYVWGGKEGLAKPVKSLGILHSDDASVGRWVLQFDDPNVLAQVNCVFVTAESGKKAVTQPTGRQLLFASLGKTINHP